MLPERFTISELKDFLDSKYLQYNHPDFIANDPISIPHLFTKKEDIEISALLTASISWGQRPVIIKNGRDLMERMDYAPYDFLLNANDADLVRFVSFKHRTFNGFDCIVFLKALQNIYRNHGGLEKSFSVKDSRNVKDCIMAFRDVFLELPHPSRAEKHLANPARGSSAKRLNMFLRWMVRTDHAGVDFGIWKIIKPSQLFCPLDVHSGKVARKLGLLKRKQNDWKAVEEVTVSLRNLDPDDPVKYDFALFGLGVFEHY